VCCRRTALLIKNAMGAQPCIVRQHSESRRRRRALRLVEAVMHTATPHATMPPDLERYQVQHKVDQTATGDGPHGILVIPRQCGYGQHSHELGTVASKRIA
jgi:hypothetical protein